MPIRISCGCDRKRDWFLGSYKIVNYAFSRPFISFSFRDWINNDLIASNSYNNISIELTESGYSTVKPGDTTITINASTERRSLFLSVKPDGSCIHSYSGGNQSATQRNVREGLNPFDRSASLTFTLDSSYTDRSNGSKKISYSYIGSSYQSSSVLPPFASGLTKYLGNISYSISFGENTIDAFIDVFPILKSVYPLNFLFSQLDGSLYMVSSLQASMNPNECGIIGGSHDFAASYNDPFTTQSSAYLEANITSPKSSFLISDPSSTLKSIQNTTIQTEGRTKNLSENGISPGSNYLEYVNYLLISSTYNGIRLGGISRNIRVKAPYYKYFVIRAFEFYEQVYPRWKIIETSIKECNIGEEISIPDPNIQERVSVLFPNPGYIYNILYIQPTNDFWQSELTKFYDSNGDSILSCLYNNKTYIKYTNIDLPYGSEPDYERYDDLPFLTEDNIFSIFGDPFESSYLGIAEKSSTQTSVIWADGVKKFIPDPE